MALIKIQGWAEQGGSVVIVSGLSSIPVDFQKSFPFSTITIYLTGTSTLAPLFQDSAGLTPQANPFTASSTAYWSAYIATGTYDVTFSGAGISSPFTISAITVGGSGGGGGGSEWGVYNPLDHGALGDGVTNDTAAFTTILGLIGSSTATIIFPFIEGSVSQYLVNTLTFPLNVTLDFFPGGSLKPANGQTILISGKVIAQQNQIFFNSKGTSAGQGQISFGNGSPVNSTDGFAPQQRDFWAEWWGALGDNVTPSADFLDAAFLALPNGSTMRLAGKFYYLEHGVTFPYKLHCTLIGCDTEVGLGGHLIKPIFVYHGTAGGTVFTANNVYSCTFHGFGLYGSDGSSPNQAKTNFLLTYDNPPIGGSSPNITSHCYLIGIQNWALSARTDWTGILISNVGGNNEHHTIRECEFLGQQTYTDVAFGQCGINLAQTQAQRIIVERNNFSALSVGVSITGNIMAYNNIFGSVGTPWWGQSPNNNVVVMGDDVELAGRLVNIVTTNGPFTMAFICGKYASIGGGTNFGSSDDPSTAPIRIQSSGDLSFYNCNLNNAGTPGQDFGPYLVGGPNNGVGAVEFYNCLIGTTLNVNIYAPGFATCSTRYIKGEQDLRWGGDTNANISLLAGAPPTKGSLRPIVELRGPTAVTPADPLTLGGAYGVDGLYPIGLFNTVTVGTPGATLLHLTVIGVDAAGRRTGHRLNDFLSVANANATLSGTNYITIIWYSLSPAPDHYEVYDVDPGNSANWRKIANVAPTGNVLEAYNIQANPAGPYTATQPPFNEAGIINFRNVSLYPLESTFTDGDTIPSVAIINDFLTANTTDKTITNFLNPSVGQIIRIRCGDSHTTIANNANIITATSGSLKLLLGLVYTFIYRAGAWHQIANAPPSEVLLSSTAAVDMNTATATTLYTVATGRSAIITKIVVSNASTSLTTASFSFGYNNPNYNNLFATATHTELTGSTLFTIIRASGTAGLIGTSTSVLKVLMNVLQGAPATTTMDVFGYLF